MQQHILQLRNNSTVIHITNFLSIEQVNEYIAYFEKEEYIGGSTSYGSKIKRLQKYYQNDNIYFSPLWKARYERWSPHRYPAWLNNLQHLCQKKCDELFGEIKQFNSALVNKYRSGNDSIRAHQDNLEIWGENPIVASLSFGTTRSFILQKVFFDKNNIKSMKRDQDEPICIRLAKGDLLIMAGETQKEYVHSIPPEPECKGTRFNVSFRNINI